MSELRDNPDEITTIGPSSEGYGDFRKRLGSAGQVRKPDEFSRDSVEKINAEINRARKIAARVYGVKLEKLMAEHPGGVAAAVKALEIAAGEEAIAPFMKKADLKVGKERLYSFYDSARAAIKEEHSQETVNHFNHNIIIVRAFYQRLEELKGLYEKTLTGPLYGKKQYKIKEIPESYTKEINEAYEIARIHSLPPDITTLGGLEGRYKVFANSDSKTASTEYDQKLQEAKEKLADVRLKLHKEIIPQIVEEIKEYSLPSQLNPETISQVFKELSAMTSGLVELPDASKESTQMEVALKSLSAAPHERYDTFKDIYDALWIKLEKINARVENAQNQPDDAISSEAQEKIYGLLAKMGKKSSSLKVVTLTQLDKVIQEISDEHNSRPAGSKGEKQYAVEKGVLKSLDRIRKELVAQAKMREDFDEKNKQKLSVNAKEAILDIMERINTGTAYKEVSTIGELRKLISDLESEFENGVSSEVDSVRSELLDILNEQEKIVYPSQSRPEQKSVRILDAASAQRVKEILEWVPAGYKYDEKGPITTASALELVINRIDSSAIRLPLGDPNRTKLERAAKELREIHIS